MPNKNYAIDENFSRGRLIKEKFFAYQINPYAVDYERIINSSAFRRLQYKTQVFVNHQGDHFRTRLTHSLEVAQIARSLALLLGLNRDLAENISLVHDLGHTPFGHAGEESLNNKMKNYGGFSHNAHTLKIITKLETRFVEFEGLNLSFEMLEGVAKHNGRFTKIDQINPYILSYNKTFNLELDKSPSLEAQISSLADDIAYNNHDIEDGIRAELFSFEELFFIPVIGEIYQQILEEYPKIKREILVGEAKKRITAVMIEDVIYKSEKNLKNYNITSYNQVKEFPTFLISFSQEMMKVIQTIKIFLMNKMYRHKIVNNMTNSANQIISDLFDYYFNNQKEMAIILKDQFYQSLSDFDKADLIADYIAGMTDRFAINNHKTLMLKN
jgi:dGTPase